MRAIDSGWLIGNPSGLPDGIYDMRVFVSDNNGATDTSQLTFRVVSEAPVLDLVLHILVMLYRFGDIGRY